MEFPRLESDVFVAEEDDLRSPTKTGNDVANNASSHDGVVVPSADDAPQHSPSSEPRKRLVDGSGAASASDAAGHPPSSTELLTFESFVDILCDELRIPTPNLILKIRKLPDTIVRKSRDVHRLKDFQVWIDGDDGKKFPIV